MTIKKFNELIQQNNKAIDYQLSKYYLVGCTKEDLKQEILLNLWHKRGQYEPNKGSFISFIGITTKILMSKLISESQRLKASPKKLLSLDQIFEESENISLYSIIATKDVETKKELEELLSMLFYILSVREKKILSLYLRGYKARDIAKKLKLKQKQVYNGFIRIRTKAKKLYKKSNN